MENQRPAVDRLAKAYLAVNSVDVKFVYGEATDGAAKRTIQTVILVAGDIGWNSYKAIATVSVTREGIGLKLMLPFLLFNPPLAGRVYRPTVATAPMADANNQYQDEQWKRGRIPARRRVDNARLYVK